MWGIVGAGAGSAVATYAANLRQPGAVVEVPGGCLIQPAGTRRCLYCRRAYDGAVPRTCDGCGASEYEPQGFLLEAI